MAKVFNYDYPISGTVWNPCYGEDVSYSGTIHVVVNETIDQTGGVHHTFHSNTQNVVGTGLKSGAKYRLVQSDKEHTNDRNDFTYPREYTYVFNYRAVAQGNIPNYTQKFLITYIFNANGDLVSSNFRFESECP